MAARRRLRKQHRPKPKKRPTQTRVVHTERLSPQRRVAVTRAWANLDRARTEVQRAEAKEKLRATLTRAGYSAASIGSRLGWHTRRENERRKESAKRERVVSRAERRLEALPSERKTHQRKGGPSPAFLAEEKKRKEELVLALRAAGYTEAEIRSRLAVITKRRRKRARSLAQIQAEALGADEPVHGRERENWYVLYRHLMRRSKAFRRYLDEATDQGVDYEEAVDRWFSPEAE